MSTINTVYHPHHRFEWGPVLVGTVLACAISIVFMQFGAAIGLADDAPLRGEGSIASWGIIAVGIWLLWVQLMASLAGGYAAGYSRSITPEATAHDNEMRDGLYGISVWATSTVLVFIAFSIAAIITSYIDAQAGGEITDGTVTDIEQNTAVIFAFILGSTSLLSGVTAWWAATMGGEHRLTGKDFSSRLSFKKK